MLGDDHHRELLSGAGALHDRSGLLQRGRDVHQWVLRTTASAGRALRHRSGQLGSVTRPGHWAPSLARDAVAPEQLLDRWGER